MPVLDKAGEYVVALTSKCDWDCSYCAVRNSHDFRGEISLESIRHSIDQIPRSARVTLTGGEPGLLNRMDLEEAITQLEAKQSELYLETNGLFIYRYPDLLSRFYEVLYHCSRELDPDDVVLDTDHPRMRYLLVVHDGNARKLPAFAAAHPGKKWDVVEATYPFERTGPVLSKQLKHWLVCHCSRLLTRESLIRLAHGKDFERIRFLNFGHG